MRLLVVVVLLAFPSVAEAGTTLVLPDGTERPQPYQGWVDRARVPTPDLTLALHRAACPSDDNERAAALGCTDGNANIWIHPRDFDWRQTLYHELGHAHARQYLDWWERGRFAAILRKPWDEETFSDGYSLCALVGSRLRDRRISHYSYVTTRHQHRKFCLLVWRSWG